MAAVSSSLSFVGGLLSSVSRPVLPFYRRRHLFPRRPFRHAQTFTLVTFDRLTPVKSHPQERIPVTAELEFDLSLLPPKLRDIVASFQSAPDAKARYQQLLHYGTLLPSMPSALKTPLNKVRGCVSQVWVHASMDPDQDDVVQFVADSDSALTKGLAALLVLGLSGAPASLIGRIPVDWIPLLGLRSSLTPSRNNGLLNMFLLMRKKAAELQVSGVSSISEETGTHLSEKVDGLPSLGENASEVVEEVESTEGAGTAGIADPVLERDGNVRVGKRRERIREKLEEALAPVELQIDDVSHLHAGHVGVAGRNNGETHFNVRVVSKEFQGKSLLKRHRLVYSLLQEELDDGLHALSVDAKTPSEV